MRSIFKVIIGLIIINSTAVYSEDLVIPVDDLRGLRISSEKLALAIKKKLNIPLETNRIKIEDISFYEDESFFDILKYHAHVVDIFSISFTYRYESFTLPFRCKAGRYRPVTPKDRLRKGLIEVEDPYFTFGIIDCNESKCGYVIDFLDIVSDRRQFESLKQRLD